MALPDDQYPPLPPSRIPPYDSDYSTDLSSPCCSIPDKLKPWLGIGSWVITSIGFLLAIAFWKNELFTALDDLSHYLQNEGMYGYGIIYLMIFVTTIPPFPLYSTLIVLSGYTFGTWPGAFVSYTAALSGAVIVFLFSRHYFRETMSHLLTHTTSLRRAVRAIERKPQLLLLIRIAPYPYNLMNVLLAASHTLSFTTYLWCTALSLCKVVIHTSIGAGIHSFAAHHLKDHAQKEEAGGSNNAGDDDDTLSTIYTISGIVLCVAIFLYLTYVARRAVNDELDNDDEDYRGHLGHLEGGSRGRDHIRTSSVPSLPRSGARSSRPSHQTQSLSRPHSPHSRTNSRHTSLSRTSYTHHRSTRSFIQLPQAQESRVRLLDEDEMSMRQVDFET